MTVRRTRSGRDKSPAKVPDGKYRSFGTAAQDALKGLIARWPAVRAGLQSPQTLHAYIRARDLGHPMATFTGSPDIGGSFSYRDDVGGLNSERSHQPFHATFW